MAEKKTKEKRQEELAKKLGDLINTSYAAHLEDLAHSVKRTGDYIVTVAFENARGQYVKQTNGEIDWEDPAQFGMFHVEVIVQDRDDKKFIPHLDVFVRIYDKNNELVTESSAPYIWHPYAYHYGFDTVLPDDGSYHAELVIKTPNFDRQHTAHGKRYTDEVAVRLSDVEIVLPGGGEDDEITMQ
jgi:hypothetical protein